MHSKTDKKFTKSRKSDERKGLFASCILKKGLSEFWLITNVLESVAVTDNQDEILDILQRMKQQTEIRSQKERIEELEKMI